ncbi:MAG TPA: SDR family oxidoreductase [Chthoniobacterales bacterium]
MNTRKLEGKVAVVTGASKGIGAAISKALAAEGAAVVVNYSSSRDAADAVVAEIEGNGGKAVAVQANMTKQADIEHLLSETQAAFGRLDILVNNAGLYQGSPVGTITDEIFHRHFDLNVLGLILASQEALKYFGPEGGAIVNVSSIVAILCPPGLAVYNATKGAVDAITRTFSRELAGRKIRVNSVNPGLIATEGMHASGFAADAPPPPEVYGKMGVPEDIAPIVVFLASQDSGWITGQVHYATGSLI